MSKRGREIAGKEEHVVGRCVCGSKVEVEVEAEEQKKEAGSQQAQALLSSSEAVCIHIIKGLTYVKETHISCRSSINFTPGSFPQTSLCEGNRLLAMAGRCLEVREGIPSFSSLEGLVVDADGGTAASPDELSLLLPLWVTIMVVPGVSSGSGSKVTMLCELLCACTLARLRPPSSVSDINVFFISKSIQVNSLSTRKLSRRMQ